MTSHTTQKTLRTSKSPLDQGDVDAIETAFQKYTTLLNEAGGTMTLPALFSHEEIGELASDDWPAFQYVVQKHGYNAIQMDDGFRIEATSPRSKVKPDPVWTAAVQQNS